MERHAYPLILILAVSLLLTSVAYSKFVSKNVVVTISNINSDGGAKITEDINFLLTTPQDKQKYESTLDKNDLASWSSTTGLDTIKYYVDPSKLKVTNLRIIPYPLKIYSSTYGGEITIEYFVSPVINETTKKSISENTLFIVDDYKPRTHRYTLNTQVLNFKRTSRADTILEKDTTLKILLPERSIVYKATPSPYGINFKAPMNLKAVKWENQVLVKFTFAFDIEKSMSYEITEDVRDTVKGVVSIFESTNGILLTIMIVTIGLGIWFIGLKAKKIKRKR